MTYKESFMKAESFSQLEKMTKEATSVAIFLGGNPDRLKAIEDALNEVANEKGWNDEHYNQRA